MKHAAEMLARSEAVWLLVGFALLALGTWVFQNSKERLGGRISAIKAAWLAYAITLWIGVPAILSFKHMAFAILAVSMAIRAVVEIPLCLKGKWRVAYGVSHDLIHIAAVLAALRWFPVPGLGIWALLTVLSLTSELLFVRWFVKATAGPQDGIFFVPDGEAYRTINRRTAVVFLPQAACFFALLVLSINRAS